MPPKNNFYNLSRDGDIIFTKAGLDELSKHYNLKIGVTEVLVENIMDTGLEKRILDI